MMGFVWAQAMLFPRFSLRKAFRCAAVIAAGVLGGCGDSCFVGFVNNGTGSVVVKAGSTPRSCSLTKTNGAVRVVALQSPVCETCTNAARVAHAFVTARGIQLRSGASSETEPEDWLEIAPQLASEPRQIDLMGKASDILVENAMISAGSYREIRLQFFSGSTLNGEKALSQNACGDGGWNCLVLGDGHVEPLRFSGDVPELRIAIQSVESDSFALLPGTSAELQLALRPRQVFSSSASVALQLQYVLAGRAAAMRQ